MLINLHLRIAIHSYLFIKFFFKKQFCACRSNLKHLVKFSSQFSLVIKTNPKYR